MSVYIQSLVCLDERSLLMLAPSPYHVRFVKDDFLTYWLSHTVVYHWQAFNWGIYHVSGMCIYRSRSCSFFSVHREASFSTVSFNAGYSSGVNSMVWCVYITFCSAYMHVFLLKRPQRQIVGLMQSWSFASGAVGRLIRLRPDPFGTRKTLPSVWIFSWLLLYNIVWTMSAFVVRTVLYIVQ